MGEVTGKPSTADTSEILAEHERIRDMAREIQGSRDLEQVLRGLQEFRALLVRHFLREEEPDGFYETIRIAAPRHIAKINQLRAEHEVFLGMIGSLAELVRACLEGPVADVRRDVAALAGRLKDHEDREDRLLLDIMYTDLGHGDS